MQKESDQSGFGWLLANDQVILAGLVTGLLLVLIQWVIVLWYVWQMPAEIPLFYSLPGGSDQLAIKNWLWLIPVISTISLMISLLIIRLSLSVERVFHQLMMWLTCLVGFLGLVVLVHILVLVF